MTAESCDVLHCRNERSWVITTLSCLIPLAGFEVSLIGRFSGVPRGSESAGIAEHYPLHPVAGRLRMVTAVAAQNIIWRSLDNSSSSGIIVSSNGDAGRIVATARRVTS